MNLTCENCKDHKDKSNFGRRRKNGSWIKVETCKDCYILKRNKDFYKNKNVKELLDHFVIRSKHSLGGLFKIIRNHDYLYNELKNDTLFLDEQYQDISIPQRLYHIYFDFLKIEKCPCCDKPKKFRNKGFSTYRYSDPTGSKAANYYAYCGNINCLEQIKVLNQEKSARVNNNNDFSKWKLKLDKAVLNKYGVSHISHSVDTRDKQIKTCMITYKVNHPMQNIDIFNKQKISAFRLKEYVFPSGRIEKIQGFEHLAINELLKSGIHENDIVCSDIEIEKHIGTILYSDATGKSHRYFPDIYIKSLNKIIEVKSTFSYKSEIDKNNLKMEAVLSTGKLFEFMIYDRKMNRV